MRQHASEFALLGSSGNITGPVLKGPFGVYQSVIWHDDYITYLIVFPKSEKGLSRKSTTY